MKTFTVIGFDSNRTIRIFCVEACDGLHAFGVAAQDDDCDDDFEFVASVRGHFKEGTGIEFPGEGLVDAETVLDQHDVFGGLA